MGYLPSYSGETASPAIDDDQTSGFLSLAGDISAKLQGYTRQADTSHPVGAYETQFVPSTRSLAVLVLMVWSLSPCTLPGSNSSR